MAIRGLTHNADGILHQVVKYRGKISTGYAPKEPPNLENHPVACGYFRMLREITQTQQIGASQKEVVIKKWISFQQAQTALEKQNKDSKTPRIIEFVSLYHSPEEMWESCMAMFSSSDGLLCRSNGEGTVAKYLTFGPNRERIWVDRKFNDVPGCAYKNCPDFASGKCHCFGVMKVFPTCDLSTMPYRLETRSVNTIIGIETSLNNMWMLLRAAHTIRQMEENKQLPFDGFFGAKLLLVHRKVKSGGKEVFITDLYPSNDFNISVMEPLKRALAKKSQMAVLAGASGNMGLLDMAANNLLAAPQEVITPESVDDLPTALDLADQQAVAVNFGADADEEEAAQPRAENDAERDKGAASLLENGPQKQ